MLVADAPDCASLFLDAVARHAGRPAVLQAGQSISYGALGDLTGRFAAICARHGDHPRVAILCPAGAEAFAAMYGTLLAGGFYCPINLNAPEEKRRRILDDFEPDVIAVIGATASAATAWPGGAALVDMNDLPAASLVAPKTPHELAYVIFTSGSTGAPKGVMVRRSGLNHYISWIGSAIDPMPQDVWSQHPNLGFDLSVMDVYGALSHGAALCCLSTPERQLVPARAIPKHGITIWNSVPSVVDLMFKDRKGVDRAMLESLRIMTFCGEPLLIDHVEALFSIRSDMVIQNTYGPTEATVSCTEVTITASNYRELGQGSMALGAPIAGMQIALDGDGPDEGEIVIAGPQVAAGYWKNESATEASFISHARGGQDGFDYRTGDWARIVGGQLYFSHRIDQQVKIRGYRIELNEIATAIKRLGVPNAVVLAADQELHAVIEGSAAEYDKASVADGLGKLLEKQYIPRFYHYLPELPKNANDKLDLNAIQALVLGDR